MAIFPGSRDSEILSWRSTSELLDRIHERIAAERSKLLSGADQPILHELRERLDEEIAFEERFEEVFSEKLGEVPYARDLVQCTENLVRLAYDHFDRRKSALAFHEVCSRIKRTVIAAALRLTEQWMSEHGFGDPPGRYCWFALGCAGRGEGTPACRCESVLVFDDPDPGGPGYFPVFAPKAEELLVRLGLHSRLTSAPAHFSWQGSISEWRERVGRGMSAERRNEELEVLMELADLSLMHGNETLAQEMLLLVRGMHAHFKGALKYVALDASEMPNGVDFFGRLRVERTGPNRGLFNVEQYALRPLVANVRVLAIKYDVSATGTVERIKQVMERGPLNVDLSERLLLAFHDFSSHQVFAQVAGSNPYMNIEKLTGQAERELRSSLDAVVTLQRIVYQLFAEQT